MPYYTEDPIRDHNFDNHPHVVVAVVLVVLLLPLLLLLLLPLLRIVLTPRNYARQSRPQWNQGSAAPIGQASSAI